jgi:Fe-S cluster biosynthesis and repair protein YggX
MADSVQCSRCGRRAAAPERVFLPPDLLARVAAHTCADCWDEWREEQTRLINELRLDLAKAPSHETVHARMIEFLVLPPAGGEG